LSSKTGVSYTHYINKIIDDVNIVLNEGFPVNIGERTIRCHGTITSLVCDMLEREKLLNMKIGGFHCCSFCYLRGYMTKNIDDKRTSTVSYACHAKDAIDLHSHLSYRFDAEVAMVKKSVFRGVCGYNHFLDLKGFVLPKMIPVDAMHCLDFGIGRYFLELWMGGGPKHVPNSAYINGAPATSMGILG
jgi:hypothetical protein